MYCYDVSSVAFLHWYYNKIFAVVCFGIISNCFTLICDYFRGAVGRIRVSVSFGWSLMDVCWETHRNWTSLWTKMWFTASPVVLSAQKLHTHWTMWHISLSYVSIQYEILCLVFWYKYLQILKASYIYMRGKMTSRF